MREVRLEWSPGGFVEILRIYGTNKPVEHLNHEPPADRTTIRYTDILPVPSPEPALCAARQWRRAESPANQRPSARQLHPLDLLRINLRDRTGGMT